MRVSAAHSLPTCDLASSDPSSVYQAVSHLAVLKLDGANADALKCKAVLLIEASRFEEALDLLEAKQLSASLAFEKACQRPFHILGQAS